MEQMSNDAVANMAKVHDDIKAMTEDMREIADALQIGKLSFLKHNLMYIQYYFIFKIFFNYLN